MNMPLKRAFVSIALLLCACGPSSPKGAASTSQSAETFSDRAIASAKRGNEVEAIALMRSGCEKGESRSCSLLAERYIQGRGIARDLKKGLELYDKACTGGHAVACQKLGSLYANGGYNDGTEDGAVTMDHDPVRSFHFHERACALDLADGCMSVAYMYEHGESVAKDLAKADAMYRAACTKGSGDACYALAQKIDSAERKQERKALLVKGCQLQGAFACGELANEFAGEDVCCAYGALMRSCVGGVQQACIAASVHIGKPILSSYLQQCRGGAFSACEYLKVDLGKYESLQRDEK